MAWIESHQSLERHPKVAGFRKDMGWSKNETIGFLHRFWWLVLEVADSGDITKFSAEFVAEELDMSEDVMKKAFKSMEGRWIDRIDGMVIVHDWLEYAGKFLREYRYRRKLETWGKIVKLHNSLKILSMKKKKKSAYSMRDTKPNQT